jgi:hypothetical protein
MTKDEALKLALKFVEDSECGTADLEAHIKEALAQPEQEPVAFASHGVVNWIADKQFQHEALLYSAPQRTWVGLTKEERHEISMANRPYCADVMAAHEEELKRRNT